MMIQVHKVPMSAMLVTQTKTFSGKRAFNATPINITAAEAVMLRVGTCARLSCPSELGAWRRRARKNTSRPVV